MRNESKTRRRECAPEIEKTLLLIHVPVDPQTTASHSQISCDGSYYGLFCIVNLTSEELIHPGNEHHLFVAEEGKR